jgi:hypothetical protein
MIKPLSHVKVKMSGDTDGTVKFSLTIVMRRAARTAMPVY